MISAIFVNLNNRIRNDEGSEVTEQVFWIGLIILAVVLLLPQLRTALVSKLSDLITALGQ